MRPALTLPQSIELLVAKGGQTRCVASARVSVPEQDAAAARCVPRYVCGERGGEGRAAVTVNKAEFFAKLATCAERELPSATYEQHITMGTESAFGTDGAEDGQAPAAAPPSSTARWLVSAAIGGGESRRLALDAGDVADLRLVPWAGVAARIGGEGEAVDRRGRAYCFLPLPATTGLPVHVNGFFELSNNRRDIWFGSDMAGDGQLRSDWNVALLQDVVAPAYVSLLLAAVSTLGDCEQYYGLWPSDTGVEPWSFVVAQFFKVVMEAPVLHTELDGGTWVAPTSALLADTEWEEGAELTRVLLLLGLPVATPPAHVRKMLCATGGDVSVVSPALVRQELKQRGALKLRDGAGVAREDALLLLRYCMHDVEGAAYSVLIGLPLLPTADGGTACFQPPEHAEQVYTCGELELELAVSFGHMLVDRGVGEALLARLCGAELQAACNVCTLNPRWELFSLCLLPWLFSVHAL